MTQKLSAMKYIKNNKRRISVLIISLMFCFVLFYLSQFLLYVTSESFGDLLIHNAEKIQYVSLPSYTFGLDSEALEALGEEGFIEQKYQKSMELLSKLKEQKGIKEVYYTDIYWIELSAVVGQLGGECPMIPVKELPDFLKHFNARIIEGRMPEKDREVLLDEKYMKNNKYKLGDSLRDFSNTKIVGVLESDYYLACGALENEQIPVYNPEFVVLTDGTVEDMADLLRDIGYEFEDNDAGIVDIKNGKEDLQKDIIDTIDNSTRVVFVGITGIMSLAILIVYVTYLRDRRNEWCLYCSIGFSRKNIYYAVMRELLFTFITALAIGGVITLSSMVILEHTMIGALGLRCRYFYPDMLFQILCVYALIMGLLQIPIRVALYKIRTIDAIDDDLL
ncbi:MAG: hypothetical protein K2I10_15235 [Lachnospiraceae bacterium]|nr:hypothetical protein [Lachnospiraceae bacterium]